MSAVETDVLIIGAGPVGLFGAFYAGARGLRVTVVDSLSQLGGQVTAMYPEKRIYDIAGLPSVKGRELVDSLAKQAAVADPAYVLGEEAQSLDRVGERLLVTTSKGTQISTGAIVITGGIGTFTPRPLPAGEEYLERGLEYFVPDPVDYQNRDVVIVGGGDSAIDWCMMLEPIARSVTLVHRREQFRAHEASVEHVRNSSVRVLTSAELTALSGTSSIETAEISFKDGGSLTLSCERVVAALGFTANLGPLREWGLELESNRHIVVDSAMETGVPGIYAAGDIAEYRGKVRLIAVGFGEVATAINNAAVYLDPDVQLFPGHSSDATPVGV